MTIRLSRGSRLFRAAVILGISFLLTWMLSTRFGMIPPIGHFTNPWQGFWQNMERDGVPDLTLVSDKLQSGATIRYDGRGVPHIFAENDYDLYFAQGLVTARDRLWQIDFQTRAAAGRLAEMIGPIAVSYDRAQRRLGMTYGAEINAAALMSDPRTALMVQAYSDGYNAWLKQLKPKDYPVEFKIFDIEPEPFTPLHSALLLMNMSQTLTSGTRAYAQTNARALLEEEVYRLLYPVELPWMDPIIPRDQTWEFEPLEPASPEPGFIPRVIRELISDGQNVDSVDQSHITKQRKPGNSSNVWPLNAGESGIESNAWILDAHTSGIGSNSWAVDGSKTASGYPILSSDPHLSVTLPSIWYEIQLNSDGINTYGVSLPGAPGVIIGFNEHLAWGVTNTGSNTLDIFEIEFRDESRTEYLHDGAWKPVRKRIEQIRVRGGKTVIDTVLYTHHGPVAQPFGERVASDRFPEDHAIKWIAHLPDHNILLAIYKFNRARNQHEFEAGLRHFTNLPQNVTYADRDGNISMGHMGYFPVRFSGQGSYIGNGRDPAYDWNRFIPFEHLPRSFNPERGFVSSANQTPAGSEYPYYLGRDHFGYSRGARINEILAGADHITMVFFEKMLMDNHSLPTARILPLLLPQLDPESENRPEIEITIAEMLVKWDSSFDADSPIALFYAYWENRLMNALWDPLFDPYDRHLRRPDVTTTFRLLLDGEHHVFPVDIGEAVTRSFRETVQHFVNRHGYDPEIWHYGRDRTVRIGHLAMLPGFGLDHVTASGRPDAINATGSAHAPSWRMIVELGPEIRARGHFPGGQSGNPGHPAFDRSVQDWAEGRFFDLHFWRSAADQPGKTASTLFLQPQSR